MQRKELIVGKTYKITKYLNFTLIAKTDKTLTIGVGNNGGEKLGYIKWIGSFRKYGFQTLPGIATPISYDTTCLMEIVDEINILNEQHKGA